MKIIIIGAGKVGYNLAENLARENHSITIIDKNFNVLKKVEDNLDVLCIRGNGVSTSTLINAGVSECDLLMAVTNSDEVNMVCCLTAKKLNAMHTIARIRDHEYARELSLLKEELGLEMVINPELAAADEIAQSLDFSSALSVETFAKGKVKMVEFKVSKEMPVAGKNLREILHNSDVSVLIGLVVRGEEVIVPKGNFIIQENDKIHIVGETSSIHKFCQISGATMHKLKKIMILGGGRITYYLTNILTDMGMKVKIIEIDKERCLELTELLPKALIINADGTDEELLLSENIIDMDGFIAVTGIDEENLLSSLLVKQKGVKKVVAKISRTNYINVVSNLGIDSIICPKVITTNKILKYVRGNNIAALYRILEDKAEVLEFIANEDNKLLNIPLKNIKFKENVIIATLIRDEKIIIPHGDDVIEKDDRVVVIVKNENVSSLYDLTADFSGGIQNELWNGIKKLGDFINM